MHKRLTKIVCTLGPASNTEDQIRQLVASGMNVCRINLSHGNYESHGAVIARVRAVSAALQVPVGILVDTSGPEIRTGDRKEPLLLKRNDVVVFCPTDKAPAESKEPVITVNHEFFAEDAVHARAILVDNGELGFELLEVTKDGLVRARALQEGKIGSRRHVNLPGARLSMPSLTDRDWEDIRFGCEQGAEFLALSFVRTAEDITAVRRFTKDFPVQPQIIAKIETQEALEDIEAIVEACDGIMVARGDLGAEVPFERLPAIQDELVTRCLDARKPVIVATHMLESMCEHPIPTRAEMTDVAHAAMTLTDATMLSGETASGKHPALAVEAMHKLLQATEEYLGRFTPTHSIALRSSTDVEVEGIIQLARDNKAAVILVEDESKEAVAALSNARSGIPVVVRTDDAEWRQRCSLLYGVFAFPVQGAIPASLQETPAVLVLSLPPNQKDGRRFKATVLK